MSGLSAFLQTATIPHETIAGNQQAIFDRLLEESPFLDQPNFSRIHPDDLERLFDLYDRTYFAGRVRDSLAGAPLTFQLSKRMTQSGGKTMRRQLRHPDGSVMRTEFSISISTTLMFQTFRDERRPITVTGMLCQNRLQALQRVMEHEIIHLCEMLAWQVSNCSASRFQNLARVFFGHREHTHQLITPRERAFTEYGIRTGDQVTFRLDGQHLTGFVNRITKRATVLVEDPSGQPYSNGKRYRKFYVPISLLRPTGDACS